MSNEYNDYDNYNNYNNIRRRLPLILMIILMILPIIYRLLTPITDIECSKAKDSCSIHTWDTIFRTPKLVDEFKISDIKQYKIDSHYYSSRRRHYTSYRITLYLKKDKVIHLKNETRSYSRAEAICEGIMNDDNFTLEGDFWKSYRHNY